MNKKILYIVPHRLDRSPGQRFRCEQYIEFLENEGYSITYSNILNKTDDRIFYSKGNYILKLYILLKSISKRICDLLRAHNYDIIFIYREAIMIGSTFFEKQLKRTGAALIYDFDDSIWLNDTSEGNQKLQWMKRPAKTADICRLSDLVIVGNEYLAHYASEYNKNVIIIPTTIDTNYHLNPQKYSNRNPVCIGWTGTSTTLKHFESILPALLSIKSIYKEAVSFKLIIDIPYINEELGIIATAWNKETEIDDLADIDIGIMPLPNDEWSKGKCGFKGLQYMSLGIPTVMSPYGVNKEIISHGINGFHAETETQWIDILSFLINDFDQRKIIGEKGLQTVVGKYSVDSQKELYVSLFKSLTK